MVPVACIVEGHGEVDAVPHLLRRLALCVDPGFVPFIGHPARVSRSKLVKEGELERTVDLAARSVRPEGGVVILIDADDECPAETGPALQQRARAVVTDIPVSVVIAKHEYEAWLIAGARPLAGRRGLPYDLEPHPDPESLTDAKGWFSGRMQVGRTYRETLDQAALTTQFDLAAARAANSFDKCCREVVGMLTKLWEAAH